MTTAAIIAALALAALPAVDRGAGIEASRPLATVVEVRNADVVWISPGPVHVVDGVDLTIGWVAHADADGLASFRVSPDVDYTVTARVGDWLDGYDEWIYELPVTREHRIETAVRDRVDAERRFVAEGANYFDFIWWLRVIIDEGGGLR